MGFRSTFFPYEALSEMARELSERTGQKITISSLCDRAGGGRLVRGAFGANLEEKLSRLVGPAEARKYLREFAEWYAIERTR